MILSDNETRHDLLKNKAIARTIVDIICDSKESVSIGVHGDWGAGKSSVLAMVEKEIEDSQKISSNKFKCSCIRFNGWQHQGFEDSKISLMSAIVSQLAELAMQHPLKEAKHNIKEITKKLWKNINWLGIAKQVGYIGFSLATGTAPLTLLTSAYDTLKEHVDSKEDIEETIENIGAYIQKSNIFEDTSSTKEFNEFQKNFKELLKLADIDKIVVIIDDLDRCLPTVAIETLEAVRMFMFMEETAFIIGADEVMIRYAVKKHFPDMEQEKSVNIGDNFADKYLEKLIQIPFRIPALGSVEAQLYITLLMIGSVKDIPESLYTELIEASLEKLEKPWDIIPLNISDVRDVLGEEYYKKAMNQTVIAMQISPILYQYSRGNPRVIKRFINMLLIRYSVAKNRGYGNELDLKILAKLMLAERKWPKLYENIAMHLIDGKSSELAYAEDAYNVTNDASNTTGALKKSQKKMSGKNSQKSEMKTHKSKDDEYRNQEENLDWIMSGDYKAWIKSSPALKNQDLRPYYTACKEKIDFFSGLESNDRLRELIDTLMKDEAIIVGEKDKIKDLTEEDAARAFEIVSANVSTGDLSNEPNGFAGLRILAEVHPSLRSGLVDFVSALPPDRVEEWIITGWEKCIPVGCDERNKLDAYFDKLREEGSEWIKIALDAKKV